MMNLIKSIELQIYRRTWLDNLIDRLRGIEPYRDNMQLVLYPDRIDVEDHLEIKINKVK